MIVPLVGSLFIDFFNAAIITFFAKAENYSTGSTWVLCTDQTLPDATIGELTVGEGDVHATRQGVVFFNLHNNGFVDLPKKTQVDLYCGDRLLESYSTPKTLEPGGSMEFGFAGSFSDKPGEKEVYAKVNQNRSVEEVNYENNTSERIKVYIKPLLTVTEINTDQGWYATEEPVVITGKCEGLEVAEADVELYAIQGGSRTVINTKTDEFGNFCASWDHPGTLAGIFLLGGCMPGEELTSTLAQISLYGMRRTSTSFLTHEMEEDQAARELVHKYEVLANVPFVAMSFYNSEGFLIDLNDSMKELCGITDDNPESKRFWETVNMFDITLFRGIYSPEDRDDILFCQHMHYEEFGINEYIECHIRPLFNIFIFNIRSTNINVVNETFLFLFSFSMIQVIPLQFNNEKKTF